MKLSKETIFQFFSNSKEKIKYFGVKRLGLFGSYARHEESENSDIDILVEFKPGCKSFDNFMNLSFFLEDSFHKRVELVTPKAISPYLKSHIMDEVEFVDFK